VKENDRIIFYPGGHKPGRKGRFVKELDQDKHPGIVHVRLDTDPFDVCVLSQYVRKLKRKNTDKETNAMPTATKDKPKAKDLRRSAKALGVKDWEDMDLEELIDAVAKAERKQSKSGSKTSGKKASKPAKVVDEGDEDEDDEDEDEAPAKSAKKSSKKAGKKAPAKAAKKSSKKAKDEDDDAAENGNPFTPGTNLFYMTEELIKGGKRSAMVKRLAKKISLKPRTRSFTEEEELEELDRRLVICSQVLRNDHGFEMEREGRGADTVIRLWKD
jgi:hypothetical protein